MTEWGAHMQLDGIFFFFLIGTFMQTFYATELPNIQATERYNRRGRISEMCNTSNGGKAISS